MDDIRREGPRQVGKRSLALTYKLETWPTLARYSSDWTAFEHRFSRTRRWPFSSYFTKHFTAIRIFCLIGRKTRIPEDRMHLIGGPYAPSIGKIVRLGVDS